MDKGTSGEPAGDGSASPHSLDQGSSQPSEAIVGRDGAASGSSVGAAGRAVPDEAQRPTPTQTGDKENDTPAKDDSAGVQDSEKASGADVNECTNVCEHEKRRRNGEPVKKKRRRGRSRKRQPSRPGAASSSAPSEPGATTEYLLRYTCQLLKSQALDYEVRGREIEEKNSAQALEIEAMEKKVHALKRRLHDLQYDEAATARASLATANGESERKRPSDGIVSNGTIPSVTSIDATDSLIPVNVAQIEDKLQQLIRERTQKLTEFALSLPGDFKETLEQQIARLVDKVHSVRQS